MFHIHKWSKWDDSLLEVMAFRRRTGELRTWNEPGQVRRCLRCNKKQLRQEGD